MKRAEMEKFIKGKRYKDKDGDFVKFDYFSYFEGYLNYTARKTPSNSESYVNLTGSRLINKYFYKCIPMTIKEMEKHLPKSEWWEEVNSDMFPIY